MSEIITSAEIGMFVAFSLMVIGVGMAMRRRSKRTQEAKAIYEMERSKTQHDLDTPTEPVATETPETESTETGKLDVDRILDEVRDDQSK